MWNERYGEEKGGERERERERDEPAAAMHDATEVHNLAGKN